jgi:hypothetical protein
MLGRDLHEPPLTIWLPMKSRDTVGKPGPLGSRTASKRLGKDLLVPGLVMAQKRQGTTVWPQSRGGIVLLIVAQTNPLPGRPVLEKEPTTIIIMFLINPVLVKHHASRRWYWPR